MDCSPPGSSVHEIFQQGYWSGLPFPSPGDLPDPGIELGSPALQADSLSTELQGKSKEYNHSGFGIDHLVMSMCRVFSCVVGRGCLLWPVRSLGKTLLALHLLRFVLQGQICLLLKGCCWMIRCGILGLRRRWIQSGARDPARLDHSELLCNKVLLKYKGDRESFWHRHQRGQKEYPPPSL